MHYKIKEFDDGYKVCKKDEPNKCFSKKGLPLLRAKKQMKAIQINERLEGSGDMPSLDVLQKLAAQSYKPEPMEKVGQFTLMKHTLTLKFYKDDLSNTIIVAIRGTNTKDVQDLKADGLIAVGNLENSSRYKNDLETLQNFQVENPQSKYDYYGVGHSLGGAILDLFLKKGLLKAGISYNPAVQPQDFIDTTLQNRRIYIESDPLYKIMGQFLTKKPEVRPARTKSFIEKAIDLIPPAPVSSETPWWRRAIDLIPKASTAYNLYRSHQLKGFEGGGKPKDEELYNKVKEEVYKKNPVHSLYRSALIQKVYKSRGGEYEEGEKPKMNIKKWFKQDWRSLNDYLRDENVACGNSDTMKKYGEYPLCRPLAIAEKLSKGDIKKLIKEKNVLKEKPLIISKVLNRNDLNIKTTNSGKGKGKFQKQLQKLNITQDEYLNYAKKIAKMRGYDPKKLELANDDKHKLNYDGVPFGAVGYKDYILYLHLAKEKEITLEEANKKMINYRKRSYKIMKETNNKYSPATLAYNITW